MPETDVIIRVENISKRFRMAARQISLRHEAQSLARALLRWAADDTASQFYALREVSFSVRRGEAVALVGRNGSGKTTLLRIMTRIMRPTEGRVLIEGRYSALIGLGAGFIPTMTGRENIFLNAAFHGTPPSHTQVMLDDIIAFADIGDFIDMPVKDYSSGMRARLGFSVAVHVLPQIIFLDEVLAVGDAAFQLKCIERILQMKNEGSTIIFVSHSAQAVRSLCDRALWLDKGVLVQDGPVGEVMAAYTEKYGAGRAARPIDTL
jgi:lipopolysaccharide transport system ATP-binding protein